MYAHTHTCMYTHACTHTCTHTHTHTHVHTHMYAHTHACTHRHMYAHTCTLTHVHTHRHAHDMHACARTHQHTHIYTHGYACGVHACTRTHTHTCTSTYPRIAANPRGHISRVVWQLPGDSNAPYCLASWPVPAWRGKEMSALRRSPSLPPISLSLSLSLSLSPLYSACASFVCLSIGLTSQRVPLYTYIYPSFASYFVCPTAEPLSQ